MEMNVERLQVSL